MADPAALAERLDKARTSVTAITQLSDDVPDLDLETGYAVQQLLREGRGKLVGWKLGVTSRAKQQQVGVDSPIYGFLASDHVLDVGEPLVTAEHINPRCEPEIVFVMGRDLVRRTRHRDRGTGGDGRCGGRDRGARLALHRLPVHDARRGGGQRLGRAVRHRHAGPARRASTCGWWAWCSSTTATSSAPRRVPPRSATLRQPSRGWSARSPAPARGCAPATSILSGGLTAAVPVSAGDVVVATIDRIGSVELACR